MNHKFCTKCGTRLHHIDAPCHKCPTNQNVNHFDLPTLKLPSKPSQMEIKIHFKEVAKRNGIKNAYQLQKKTGFHMATAYNLWKEKWEKIDLKTLNTICDIFICTPNDLLVLTPLSDD